MSNTHKHKAKGKFNNGLLEEPDNTYERMADRYNKKRGEFRKIKKDLEDKIAEKELKEEIRIVETGENIDFDIPEQEQIMGR
jgi:tRNA(Ile2) C34 agmatinyltransferase TiaS